MFRTLKKIAESIHFASCACQVRQGHRRVDTAYRGAGIGKIGKTKKVRAKRLNKEGKTKKGLIIISNIILDGRWNRGEVS